MSFPPNIAKTSTKYHKTADKSRRWRRRVFAVLVATNGANAGESVQLFFKMIFKNTYRGEVFERDPLQDINCR